MKPIKLLFDIVFKEGIISYIKRKRNITYLDNKTTFKINYRDRKTKILLNRKFGHVDMSIFRNGIYEKDILDDIYNELKPDSIFVDIGANIGQHSLLMSPYCKNIYAFEPIPAVYRQFKKSIQINHIKNIHIFNAAVGDKKENKKFNYVAGHAGTSSFIERDNPISENIVVQTVTLKEILGNIKIDVLKLDVEGYEAVVIMGNKEKILKDKPVIFMEYNPKWIQKDGSFKTNEVFDLFFNNGFTIYSRNTKKNLTREDLDTKSQDNWIVRQSQKKL